LVTALSSLLYFARARDHASQLFNQKKKLQETIEIWDELNQFLVSLNKMLRLESVDYSVLPIESIDYDIPIITCQRASDGQEDHTVTIYKKWIFDGNFQYALPLSKTSLDICCSSDEQKCSYESMLHTYIFPYFKDYMESLGPNKRQAKKIKKRNLKKGKLRRQKK
jgi:hypothetical protein